MSVIRSKDWKSLVSLQVYTWNTDAWGYNQNTTSLYQSHPWVFAVLPSGEAFGVLADTSRRCEVRLLMALFTLNGFSTCKLLCLRDGLYFHLYSFLNPIFVVQIDLRKSSVIRICAVAPFPVITFGPYATPEALMTGLTHAIGILLCIFIFLFLNLCELIKVHIYGRLCIVAF